MRQYKNYTSSELIDAVRASKSRAEVLRKLGLNVAGGGNNSTIKKKILELGIDISHWTGPLWNKGLFLKEIHQYKRKESIKKKLIQDRGYQCEGCKLTLWMGNKIKLEVHHKDGDKTHNKNDNLQLLCPNCHSFTPNWKKKYATVS